MRPHANERHNVTAYSIRFPGALPPHTPGDSGWESSHGWLFFVLLFLLWFAPAFVKNLVFPGRACVCECMCTPCHLLFYPALYRTIGTAGEGGEAAEIWELSHCLCVWLSLRKSITSVMCVHFLYVSIGRRRKCVIAVHVQVGGGFPNNPVRLCMCVSFVHKEEEQ